MAEVFYLSIFVDMNTPFLSVTLAGILLLSACQNTPDKSAPGSSAAQRYEMPDSLKKEMTEELDHFIKSGFYDSVEVIENMCDMFYKEKIDTPWLAGVAMRAYRRREAEQASWPAVTDFDKLVKAFDRLNANGIVALHNAGNTKDEDEDDASEIRTALSGTHLRGFCGYDTQDVDGLIDGGKGLYITFGSFNDSKKACTLIGKEVDAQLRAAGFTTVWDQTCDTRIMIKPIRWQKRFGNGNCSYEHAKELLRKYKG